MKQPNVGAAVSGARGCEGCRNTLIEIITANIYADVTAINAKKQNAPFLQHRPLMWWKWCMGSGYTIPSENMTIFVPCAVEMRRKIECETTRHSRRIVRTVEQRWTEGRKMDNRWIPVTERLPELEEDVFVICRTSTGSVYHCIAFYVPEETPAFESGYCWDYECTHK